MRQSSTAIVANMPEGRKTTVAKALATVAALLTFSTVFLTSAPAEGANQNKQKIYSHSKQEFQKAQGAFSAQLKKMNGDIAADESWGVKKRGWIIYIAAEVAFEKAISKIKFPSGDSRDVKTLLSAIVSDESATREILVNVGNVADYNGATTLANQTYSDMNGALTVLDSDFSS